MSQNNNIKAFTKNSPACPKCGHKTRRLYYNHREYGDYGSVLEFLKEGEYFIATCQDCHYQFPQKAKDGGGE